jgi:hypothetical protein
VELHLVDALERLKGADQDPSTDALKLAAHVEHEVIAVAEIDIRVAATQKHGPSARGWSAKMMGGRILRRIRFGFDDAAGQPAGGKFAHYHFADEEAGEGNGGDGKLDAAKTAYRDVLLVPICGNT